ncbi:FMN-binding protein [Sediminicola arcticus]|uniref:FMN-binding protein n=1 Tax=Sediminicola arcticus TaxID=1574308 RepID=A0ABV2SRY7_9FLAO
MAKKIIYALLIPLICGCKEQSKFSEQNGVTTDEVVLEQKKASANLQVLLDFADITETDMAKLKDKVVFKKVVRNGNSMPIPLKMGAALFYSSPNSVKESECPVMEIVNTDKVLLISRGKGFGGPIWAKLLVDYKTHEILKIAFGHKVESEGYGAEIGRTSFQNRFIGKVLNITDNTFGLQVRGKEAINGEFTVDGISGATVTSLGVVHMLNEGVGGYSKYFEKR